MNSGSSFRGYSDAISDMDPGLGVVLLECGYASRDTILRAAGLALEGKKVFVWSQSDPLFIARGYEQIRTSVSVPNLGVIFAAVHDGDELDRGGSSMQMNEDFALMRSIPGMTVVSPSDRRSAYVLTGVLAGDSGGPAYIRLSHSSTGGVYEDGDCNFISGGARILSEGDGVTVCAAGVMVREALRAKDMLEEQGIGAEVIDCYSIKPFPERVLLSSVRRTGCCVTAEKHTGAGGLFSAAAECLGRNYPVPVRGVSVEDRFGQSGTEEELRGYYGLTHREIVRSVLQVWAIRRR